MVDEKDDTHNEHNEPTEHEEEEFSEEFDFDEAGHEEEDALAPEEFENMEEFEGAEEGEEGETAELEPPKRKSATIPIVIGVVVVGFIGWKIYGMFSKPKPAPVEVVEAPPVVKAEPPPPPPTAPAAPQPQAIPNLMEGATKVALPDEALVKLQKKIDDQEQFYKQQISALEKNLATTVQNSADTSKNIAALQHDVATLTAALQDLSTQIKGIREEQQAAIARQQEELSKRRAAKAKPKGPSKEAVASPTMTIHAIIPGRAWLRTADGKTITVTEGDAVGEYGKILKIDAPNGVVITSSGVVLR
ncbi:MAG: hypothetical protein BGO43_11805 [Gammaproteobacteria bacterium 39-13]|nr:hypothetical protein [Gammaproteobacteria bacterium]OJV85305.1 MAG: hypothetical protein BGO43_11805 [Gammaproteobacteria bacterium 39-13]